jgi:hypothetical protein
MAGPGCSLGLAMCVSVIFPAGREIFSKAECNLLKNPVILEIPAK